MANKYGISEENWQKVKSEIRGILIARAKLRGMIAYSELTVKLTTIPIDHHSSALFNLLGEISTEEDRNGRGMLSALVIQKTGEMQPGPGFFELAKLLGKNTSDITIFWIAEVKKVHAYWNDPKNVNKS